MSRRWGKPWAEYPSPGTSQAYVYTADVLAIPANSSRRLNAQAYLRAATSRDVVSTFSMQKNALPAREEMFKQGLKQRGLERVVRVPALPILVPHLAFDNLGKMLGEWLFDAPSAEPVPDALLEYIDAEYCHLRQGGCQQLRPSRPLMAK